MPSALPKACAISSINGGRVRQAVPLMATVIALSASVPAFGADITPREWSTLLALSSDWTGLAISIGLLLLACAIICGAFAGRRLQARRLRGIRTQAADRYADSGEAVVVASLSGVVLYMNAAAESLLGVSSRDAQGASIRALLPLWTESGKPVDPMDPSSALDSQGAFADVDGFGTEGAAVDAMPVLRRVATWTKSTVERVNAEGNRAAPDMMGTARGKDATIAVADLPLMIAPLVLRNPSGVIDAVGVMLRDGRAVRARLARDSHARHINGASVDAIIGVSANEVIGSWNPGARSMFAYEVEDVLGESIGMLVSADRHAVLSQTVRMAIAGERVVDRDLTMRSRDGREFDVSLAAFRVTLPEALRAADIAGATRVVLVLRDIGERRLSERRVRHLGAQLVRRAQELQAIFDIAPVGMVIADSPDCRHVRPNMALTTMLGLERAAEFSFDGGAQTGYEIWQGDALLQEADSPLHRAVRGRCEIVPTELTLRSAQREWTIMAYAAPVIDQDHSVVGAIAVFVDISEMKIVDAERQQLLSEAIDARRAAEEASRLKEEFLATVSHELRTPLNAMHGWLEIMQRKPDAETQARGMDVIRRNVRAQTRVIEDILDVSSFVKGKTRLVVRPVDLLEIARATAESLRPTADAKSISLLVENDMPATSECDAASNVVTVAPVNGDPERIQQIAWNLLSNALKFTPEGGTVVVSVYSAQAGQGTHRGTVVSDPVGNTEVSGVLSLDEAAELAEAGAASRGAMFVLSVRDTGEGIAPAFLPFVFDRFRQADSSIERRHSGLGLGLAIVRHLAELHGGYAAVESDGLGLGATFRVGFPARPVLRYTPLSEDGADDRDMAAPSSGNAGWYVVTAADSAAALAGTAGGVKNEEVYQGRLYGIGVLVVEDDQAAAEIIAEALSDEGADVRLADNAETALQVLAEWQPQVILSDIGLPGRDGCALIQAVRAMDGSIAAIFAVAVTAYAGVEDRARALRAGFDAYLVKPVAPSQLIDMLALSGRPAVTE